MEIIRDGKKYELTMDELQEAYEERDQDYRYSDAENQFSALYPDLLECLTEEDACDMIDMYYHRCDCNVPENQTWKSICDDMAERIRNRDREFSIPLKVTAKVNAKSQEEAKKAILESLPESFNAGRAEIDLREAIASLEEDGE